MGQRRLIAAMLVALTLLQQGCIDFGKVIQAGLTAALEDPRTRTYVFASLTSQSTEKPLSTWVVLPAADSPACVDDPMVEAYWAFSKDGSQKWSWVVDFTSSSEESLRGSRLICVAGKASAVMSEVLRVDPEPDLLFLTELEAPPYTTARARIIESLGADWVVTDDGLGAMRGGALSGEGTQ